MKSGNNFKGGILMEIKKKTVKPVKEKSPYTVMISAHVKPESLEYVYKLWNKQKSETGASLAFVVNSIIESKMKGDME
jgi:hypothetical protein